MVFPLNVLIFLSVPVFCIRIAITLLPCFIVYISASQGAILDVFGCFSFGCVNNTMVDQFQSNGCVMLKYCSCFTESYKCKLIQYIF